MKITVKGQVPSSKNSKKVTKTGRVYTDPRVQEWMDDAKLQLKSQWREDRIEGDVCLTVIFYNQDNRRHDLDNQLATINDCLKETILTEDDQFHISQIQLQYGGLDKKNPRAELWVDELS